MLDDRVCLTLPEFDLGIYRSVVPHDHLLLKVDQVVPWDEFTALLAPYYSADQGRPGLPPVRMLKLEYLCYHYHLTDREVIARSRTDLAFRWFLGLPLRWDLPHPTSLCIFRGRLGVEGFQRIFDRVVQSAREHGIVKDQLRLKDATHVIAAVAIPSALALVAQIRDKLLATAEPFAPLLVEGERVKLEQLRQSTQHQPPAERLLTRVKHLREILSWADELDPPPHADRHRRWQAFLTQRDLAHKILLEQEDPRRGDRTRSTVDPDARRGKHGDWYDGYLVDLTMDADSELITAVNVLTSSGEEAADALTLIRQEEQTHHNDVQALSIDGVGFNGPVLRELEDPDGLNIDTYVPCPQEPASELFTPHDFTEDVAAGVLTCPAGQTSRSRQREEKTQTTKYRFDAATCRACPLLSRCMKQPPRTQGRTVRKTDFQVEHQRARDKATTAAYQAIRREHTKVERKLGEVMNRHGGRRARYRGRPKVLMQQLLAALATNVKRLVRLADLETAAFATAN